MAAAEASSSSPNPPRADLRRRQRRLVFDRRYGWIFDEWTDPAVAALSGGRGMFCILPMAQSLMSAAASSVDYAADSVSAALKRPEIFSPLAYLPHLQLHRKQQTWFHGLERSGVVADTKLIPCSTL
ncbi:hypothetical protein CFC21_070754 [Triticum aestivum]|uniref:Uncharacterized protein n=3 Tax=Triticum TaxID=4564 RepID=A0A9R0X3U4_TRITD|nr:uncharacterized protein LOC123111112 isoform X2 [Triticum aestivum]KAF7064452.1 hypothetical protein CFC21_070754 [Triticum aestivum]VAI29587.1 unnamed protein product [Triticum turgidum subsp. durum]